MDIATHAPPMEMLRNMAGRQIPRTFILIFITLAIFIASFHNFVVTLGINRGNQELSNLEPSAEENFGNRHLIQIPEEGPNTPPQPVFVCITGQVRRLELRSKVQTILEPLREAGYEPYIALMLTDEKVARFTNRVKHADKVKDLGQAFDNYTQASEYLLERGFHVTTNKPTIQSANPILNEEYIEKVGGTAKMNSTIRVQNHARQFHTLTQCGEEMGREEREYAFLLRVREDVSLTDPLQVQKVYKELHSDPKTNRTVIATKCRRFSGMNDRMAIATPEASYDYFHAPFMRLYTKKLDTKVENPETYLQTTYERSGLKVIKSENLNFVVKLETTADGSFVLRNWEDSLFCGRAKLPARILNDSVATQLLDKKNK